MNLFSWTKLIKSCSEYCSPPQYKESMWCGWNKIVVFDRMWLKQTDRIITKEKKKKERLIARFHSFIQLTNLHLFGMRLPLFSSQTFFTLLVFYYFWHSDSCFTLLFLFNPSIDLADTFHFQYLNFFLNLSPFSISQVLNPLASSTRPSISPKIPDRGAEFGLNIRNLRERKVFG